MKKMSTELKVGIFVVLALVVLAYMTVHTDKIRFGRAVGYKITAMLDSAAGLVKNSDVRIAGVQVGSVEDIALETKTGKAKVTLSFPFHITLPVDSLAFVKSEGLLGEKYIEIQSGVSKDTLIRQGGEIRQGDSLADMDQLLSQLSSVASDIKGVTSSLNSVLGGKESEQSMRRIFDDLGEVTADLNSTVKDNRESFRIIMDNFEKLTGDLVGVSAKAEDTLNTISLIVAKIEEGEGTLGKLAADSSLYDQTRETMTSLNKIAKSIEKGEGTLGKLAADDTIYAEAKKAIKKVSKAAEAVEEQVPITVLGTVLGTVLR